MTSMEININLDELIPTNLRGCAKAILNMEVTELAMRGGRGSVKSTSIAECLLLATFHGRSSIAMLKYDSNIEKRLFNNYVAAISYLGLDEWFKTKRSPFEIIRLESPGGPPSNYGIVFQGLESPEKSKGWKPKGAKNFSYLHYEEADQLSENDVRISRASLQRGGKSMVIYSWNPPISRNSHITKRFGTDEFPCGKHIGYDTNTCVRTVERIIRGRKITETIMVNHSTYEDLFDCGFDWMLDDSTLNLISQAKERSELDYRWEWLGEVIQSPSSVFNNIVDWDSENEPIPDPDEINRALDLSNGSVDPHFFSASTIDYARKRIYVLDEFASNDPLDNIVPDLKKRNKWNATLWTDSAVPAFTQRLQDAGVNALGVKKWPGSVTAGIEWLKGYQIYVDKRKCPLTWKALIQYEYEVTKDGEVTTKLKKGQYDHPIDALRYANCLEINRYYEAVQNGEQ